jgi:hypothetical protein
MRAAALAFLLAAAVQDAKPDAWVRLADGSLLHVAWTPEALWLEKDGKRTDVEAAAVDRVVPGVWYDEAFHKAVDQALRDLADEGIETREAAAEKLLKLGTLVEPRLRELAKGSDAELAGRARTLVERIAAGEGGRLPAARPDVIDAGGRKLEGRLPPGPCAFRWRGGAFALPWGSVVELSRRPPARPAADAPPPAAFRRLAAADFPKTDRVITYDTDAKGKAIEPGSNVEERWRDWGVILDSESETSVIYADGFVVGSPSGANSGCTQEPRWVGHVNFFFHLPGSIPAEGRKGAPAGVHRFGVYVASVSPKGTGLRAYGLDGKVLHEILTTGSGTDFLGLESPVPMHRVEIFDDPAIDNNFTTDDAVFGPVVVPEGDPERFVVDLADGERIVARSIRGDAKRVAIAPAFAGPEVAAATAEVRQVMSPVRRIAFDRPVKLEKTSGAMTIDVVGGRISADVARWDEKGIEIEGAELPWERVLRVRLRE